MPVNAFFISADKHKLIFQIYNRDLILLQLLHSKKSSLFKKQKLRRRKLFAAAVFIAICLYYRRIITVLFGDLRRAAFLFSFFSLPVALVAYHLPYSGGHSFKVVS